MYLHYLYKRYFTLKWIIFFRNLHCTTFEAKMSYYAIYDIKIIRPLTCDQMFHVKMREQYVLYHIQLKQSAYLKYMCACGVI